MLSLSLIFLVLLAWNSVNLTTIWCLQPGRLSCHMLPRYQPDGLIKIGLGNGQTRPCLPYWVGLVIWQVCSCINKQEIEPTVFVFDSYKPVLTLNAHLRPPTSATEDVQVVPKERTKELGNTLVPSAQRKSKLFWKSLSKCFCFLCEWCGISFPAENMVLLMDRFFCQQF